jgi:hypothetical protein
MAASAAAAFQRANPSTGDVARVSAMMWLMQSRKGRKSAPISFRSSPERSGSLALGFRRALSRARSETHTRNVSIRALYRRTPFSHAAPKFVDSAAEAEPVAARRQAEAASNRCPSYRPNSAMRKAPPAQTLQSRVFYPSVAPCFMLQVAEARSQRQSGSKGPTSRASESQGPSGTDYERGSVERHPRRPRRVIQ